MSWNSGRPPRRPGPCGEPTGGHGRTGIEEEPVIPPGLTGQPSPQWKWTAMSSSSVADAAAPPLKANSGTWGRQLGRYPANGPRALYLGIVVLATIVLYYELYVGGSVITKIAANLDMTLTYLIAISIVGNALGALASIAAGM